MARVRVVVDTRTGAVPEAEAGDTLQPVQTVQRQITGRDHVLADLAGLLRGNRPVHRHAAVITLVQSVGAALQERAAAR